MDTSLEHARAHRWSRLFEETKRFARFGTVGIGNTIIDYGLYILLTRVFDVYYLIATVLSWLVAVMFSFIMNKYWTFRANNHRDATKQSARFLAVNIVGLLFSTALLFIFVSRLGIPDLIGKVMIIGILMFWNFFLNKFWTFKETL